MLEGFQGVIAVILEGFQGVFIPHLSPRDAPASFQAVRNSRLVVYIFGPRCFRRPYRAGIRSFPPVRGNDRNANVGEC